MTSWSFCWISSSLMKIINIILSIQRKEMLSSRHYLLHPKIGPAVILEWRLLAGYVGTFSWHQLQRECRRLIDQGIVQTWAVCQTLAAIARLRMLLLIDERYLRRIILDRVNSLSLSIKKLELSLCLPLFTISLKHWWTGSGMKNPYDVSDPHCIACSNGTPKIISSSIYIRRCIWAKRYSLFPVDIYCLCVVRG